MYTTHRATWGGGTAKKNLYWEGGGHRTYFVDGVTNWGWDTAQHRKMGGGDSAHTSLMGGTIWGNKCIVI